MKVRYMSQFGLCCALAAGCGSDSTSDTPAGSLDAGTDVSNESAVSDGRAVDRAGDAPDEADASSDESNEAGRDGRPAEAGEEANGDASDGRFEAATEGGIEAGPDAEGGKRCPWTPWTEGLTGGSIGRVQFDPRSPGTAFALAGGPLYKTTDSGRTWNIASNAASTLTQLGFPPNAPGLIIASGNKGFEVSSDGGQSWNRASLSGLALGVLLVHPAQPLRLFAGGDQGLLMRSTDQGAAWKPASAGIPFGQILGLAGDPSNEDVVVAAITLEDAAGAWTGQGAIVRTDNGGVSWQTTLTGSWRPTGMAQCAANPDIIFASTTTGLLRSRNRGLTWDTSELTGSVLTDVAIARDDCTKVYASVFGTGVVRSTNLDGGLSWSAPLANGMNLQPDYQYPEYIAVNPADGTTLLAGTHDGLFVSTNAGDLWSRVPAVNNVFVSDVSVSPRAPGHLWMASWGSGLWHRPTPSASWQRVPQSQVPRDWTFTVFADPIVSGRVFAGTWLGGGDAWRSVDQGATFSGPYDGGVNPFVFATDPRNADVIYMGTQVGSLHKSLNGGETWAPSNVGAESAFVRSLLVNPDNSSTVYMGTESNGIFRSVDSAGHWAPVMAPAGGTVASIVKSGGASPMLFAWINGVGVFRSQDGQTWTASNAGISALNEGSLVYDAESATLFADSGSALYRSSDGSNWQLFDPECPPPTGGGKPAIVSDGTTRWIVVNGRTKATGLFAHPL